MKKKPSKKRITDKERLDWLSMLNSGNWSKIFIDFVLRYMRTNEKASESLRATIDAAIRAGRKEGK